MNREMGRRLFLLQCPSPHPSPNSNREHSLKSPNSFHLLFANYVPESKRTLRVLYVFSPGRYNLFRGHIVRNSTWINGISFWLYKEKLILSYSTVHYRNNKAYKQRTQQSFLMFSTITLGRIHSRRTDNTADRIPVQEWWRNTLGKEILQPIESNGPMKSSRLKDLSNELGRVTIH